MLVRRGGALKDSALSSANANDKDAQSTPASSETAAATRPVKTAYETPASASGATSTTAALANAAQPTAAGKYELTTTETLEAVPAGEVRVLSPAADSVVMAPAMQLEARVALNWTIKLEVNGQQISDQNIGTSRLDQKNSVSTFTFVGINLRPGPNRVRATAISAEGKPGHTVELTVMGRGPARRVEIVPEATEIQAGGRASTMVRVRAFDQWNNPALDDQVAFETSAGQLLGANDTPGELKRETKRDDKSNNTTEPVSVEQGVQLQTEMVVQLENGEALLKLTGSGAPGEALLHAQVGQSEARASVRITPELRPRSWSVSPKYRWAKPCRKFLCAAKKEMFASVSASSTRAVCLATTC